MFINTGLEFKDQACYIYRSLPVSGKLQAGALGVQQTFLALTLMILIHLEVIDVAHMHILPLWTGNELRFW